MRWSRTSMDLSVMSVAKLQSRCGHGRTFGVCPVVALAGLLVTLGCAAPQKGKTEMADVERQSPTMDDSTAEYNNDSNHADSGTQSLGSELGIEILCLRLSAAGHMLDLRYRVTDLDKAAPLMDPQLKPSLLNQRTGAKLVVPSLPKVGPLRQTPENFKIDRTYFFVFGNPGRLLKTGDTAVLALGNHRVENLVIE